MKPTTVPPAKGTHEHLEKGPEQALSLAERSDALHNGTPRLCSCGRDKSHFMVSHVGKYTLTGWMWVTLMGVTTKPVRIDYKCRTCGEIFDSTTDDRLLTDHA